MDVSLFDFDLPEAQIALRPASPRDGARLMVVQADGRIEHRTATRDFLGGFLEKEEVKPGHGSYGGKEPDCDQVFEN